MDPQLYVQLDKDSKEFEISTKIPGLRFLSLTDTPVQTTTIKNMVEWTAVFSIIQRPAKTRLRLSFYCDTGTTTTTRLYGKKFISCLCKNTCIG